MRKDAKLNDHSARELIEAMEKNKQKKAGLTIPCRWCKEYFHPTRFWQEFCSSAHSSAWHSKQREMRIKGLEEKINMLEEVIWEQRRELQAYKDAFGPIPVALSPQVYSTSIPSRSSSESTA